MKLGRSMENRNKLEVTEKFGESYSRHSGDLGEKLGGGEGRLLEGPRPNMVIQQILVVKFHPHSQNNTFRELHCLFRSD